MHIDRPIAIALFLFIILLLVFFLVMPEYNMYKSLQNELGKKTAEYKAEFEYYAEIAKTHNDLIAYKDEIKKIDDALTQGPTLGKLIYFLQDTAKNNGLAVKNLFLSKTTSSNNNTNALDSVKDLVFSMDLSGDYSSLQGFIAELEKSSRIFEVTTITFGSSSGKLSSFNLQIKTHSY